MSAADFLGTNVLAYLFDETDDRERSIAAPRSYGTHTAPLVEQSASASASR
jgi:hypothetical protein